MEIKFIIFVKLFYKKITFFLFKIGSLNPFFYSLNDSVHNEPYTFPPTLKAFVRGWEKRKDDSYDCRSLILASHYPESTSLEFLKPLTLGAPRIHRSLNYS